MTGGGTTGGSRRRRRAAWRTLGEGVVAFVIVFAFAMPALAWAAFLLAPVTEQYTGYTLLAATAAALLIAALVARACARWEWRRGQSERPCERCGYELAGGPRQGTCPECGRPFKRG